MAAAVPEQEQTPWEIWIKDFFLTWINRFSFFLAHHLTRPILPLYLVSFGASSTVIGAVMAVFTITATATRIPVGLHIDRIGRKPFLIAGVALFAVSNFGYLWAPGILLMLPFRMLHGVGWSGCTTAVATLAADIAPQKRRGELIGYAAMASSLGGAIGPVAGFALLQRFDFSGVFFGAAALLFVSLILAAFVKEPEHGPRNNHRQRWIDLLVIPETLLPAVAVAFLSFGHGGILTFLPIHALKLGLENPGLWFGLYALCLLLSRPVAGPLSDRISRRAVIIPGLILNLLGIGILALASSPAWLMAAAVVGGFGTGAAQPALMTVAVDQTSPQRRGQSMAQYQCFYDLGIGLGSLTLGAFLDLVDQNFSLMYAATAVVALIGLWIYWKRS
ncbi:MAG TPA: MFS transporter [Candidatus Binatia bacterium]|nr:MFS transporter [Candidatus Binatia bacterium]